MGDAIYVPARHSGPRLPQLFKRFKAQRRPVEGCQPQAKRRFPLAVNFNRLGNRRFRYDPHRVVPAHQHKVENISDPDICQPDIWMRDAR